jgi:hypothetical protein
VDVVTAGICCGKLRPRRLNNWPFSLTSSQSTSCCGHTPMLERTASGSVRRSWPLHVTVPSCQLSQLSWVS